MFHMLCMKYVIKVALLLIYIYIYNILSHCIKLIKLVFGSRLVSSAAVNLLEFLYILSELSAGC